MYKIQEIFRQSFIAYADIYKPTALQCKTASAIINCKSGSLGFNVSQCTQCGHQEIHNNSCRNRSCPCCQAFKKELWIDARKSEVIDAPYFHAVFTLPSELNAIIYANQKLLYNLMHTCTKETLLTLSNDKKHLGATPGIIQVLHTWGQQMNYHPHIHCIITGGGLTSANQFVTSSSKFFIPIKVLGSMFRQKFMDHLNQLYQGQKLVIPSSTKKLINHYEWNAFKDSLYKKDWIPYIKETFNGFGNAIDYLGRYTHRIAISNGRIISVTDTEVTFWYYDYKTGTKETTTISHVEFIRRFMMHILPSRFQKIRYCGFLNNRGKKKNLKLITTLTGKQLFKAKYVNMPTPEILKELLDLDVTYCKNCGNNTMCHKGSLYHNRN